MKKVFVTGGTGFVGAHVIRMLVERGDKVVALARASSNLSLISELAPEIVCAEMTDVHSLLPAMEGAEQVYHVAADYRLWARDPREIYHSNVDGTRAVLEASLRLGVPRVVYTSTVGCLGLHKDGSPADENTPVTIDDMVGHYKKSKFEAERVALEYAGRGLDVVIVNPSTPVGPGDIKPTPTGRTVLDFLRGRIPAFVDTGLNLIAVEDVAQGHLLAAEKGLAGEKYILGNRNLTLKQILGILAQITGRKAPSIEIPHWVALVAAIVDTSACQLVGKEPGIPVEGVLMSRKKMFFSADKAVQSLGLPQSSVEDALARSCEWFKQKGYV